MKNIIFLFAMTLCQLEIEAKSFGNDHVHSFDLICNRIIMHIDTMNFILETGSNVSFLDSTIVSNSGLTLKSETFLPTPGKQISAVHIEFELTEFPEVNRWVVLSLDHLSNSLNYKIHGIIGIQTNILLNNVVDINFIHRKVTISTSEIGEFDNFTAYELTANNNDIQSPLGKAFPTGPAIKLPLVFNKKDTLLTNLVIDTGCQFTFAFVVGDSLFIESFSQKSQNYVALDGDKKIIRYGRVHYCSSNLDIDIDTDSPFFYKPNLTIPINNDFYGLLGVPFLKQFERVVINWSKRKIYFSKI